MGRNLGRKPGQDLEPGRWAREAGRLPTDLPPPPRVLAQMGVDLCSYLCGCIGIDLGLAHEREWLAGLLCLAPACLPACLPSCLLVPCTPSLQLHYIRAVWCMAEVPRERERKEGCSVHECRACRCRGGVALTGLRLRKKLTSASALRSTRTIAHARGAHIQPPSNGPSSN